MSDERASGFGRMSPDADRGEPIGVDSAEAALAAYSAEFEAGEPEAAPTETAAVEEGLLMDELHDPLGLESASGDRAANPRAREETDKLRRDLAEALERYPQGPGPSTPAAEAPATETSNVFTRMRRRAAEVARERVPVPGKKAVATLVIGVGLLAAAGLVADRVTGDSDRPTMTEMVALNDGYGPIRDIVSGPAQFVDHGLAGELGADYVDGAEAAEASLYNQTFASVTDPEGRLAIASVAIRSALDDGDIPALVEWLQRLAWIPGADDDARASELRMAGYVRLAEERAAQGRGEDAARWSTWAAEQEQAMAEQGDGLASIGWSPWLADHLRNGIEAAQRQVPADGVSREFRAGYIAALNEAMQNYNLMVHVAFADKDEETQTYQVPNR